MLQVVDDVVDALHAAQVGLVGQFCIDRHQVIDAVHLHGVAAVIEYGDICGARGAREADFGVVHASLVGVDGEDDIEAGALERCGDILGIVRRIGQLRRVGVGAVADDERHPPVGVRIRRPQRGGCDRQRQTNPCP